MITKLLLEIMCFVPNLLLDSMQGINLSIPENVFDGLNSIFNCLGFLFPIARFNDYFRFII